MESEYVVYILYSLSYDKTYVGYTQSLISRFLSHNHLGKKGYTKRYRPWEVMHVEFFKSKQTAMNREKYYKTGVGRAAIKKLKKDFLRLSYE